MKTKQLMKRIEELERKVKELESRQTTIIINPAQTYPTPFYPAQPIYPTYNPQPWWCDKQVVIS